MKHIWPKAAKLRGWWRLHAASRIRRPLAVGWRQVPVKLPPLQAIVAQNGSVPSYGWGRVKVEHQQDKRLIAKLSHQVLLAELEIQ